MPKDQMAKFHTECGRGKPGFEKIRACLTKIDVEDAIASVAEDETKVKEIIRGGVGFDVVNKAVGVCMKRWCASAFMEYI